jgi:transcriptional regulator with XRE-family HTH domain
MLVLHRVRQARQERGLTQRELALLLEMERTDLVKLEQRVRDPRLSTLRAIAKALKCTLDDLMAE